MKVGLGATLLIFFSVVFIGLDWPSASASMNNLRRAYPRQHVRMVTFKSESFTKACGFYVFGTSQTRLKYLETQDGLTVERTPNQWLAFAVNQRYADQWNNCMSASGRGHALDFVFDPIVVAIMGL